ncbi:hypothetical protein [Aneurinibacillus tyrosinisolvens]|uniref:hypothetical protein n=1 Tax=Aneurinibacillus tyrosinisolvens TaxID=1443435 RepID=UPI00063FCEBF|nr:hypothetical protein [Aneurinibacillus tyrosinisolvens]
MKKSKFGNSYPLAVKKIALQYPDFLIEDINTTYWFYNRDVAATTEWLDKCRTGEAHREMGISFEEEQPAYRSYTEQELEELYRDYYSEEIKRDDSLGKEVATWEIS